MGLIGLGLNGLHFARALGFNSLLAEIILFYGFFALALVSLPYFYHLIKEKIGISEQMHLLKEWQDPFQITLFPAVTLTFLLFFLSLWQLDCWQEAYLWGYLGVLLAHTVLFLRMVSRWLFDARIELSHLKPTWFILLSGNFVAVISGLTLLPESWQEGLWFYFSVSIFIWLTLVFSLFYRLIFIQPITLKMRPTLFIFLAPPSLGTVASLLLLPNDQPSFLTWAFYSFATLMLLIWLFAIMHFRNSELSMVSWAYVYPLAAYGLASQYMAEALHAPFLWVWSSVLFLVTLGFVILISTWLIKQIPKGNGV